MSAPEMHRLERAALEDPFLSDALEGMEIHQTHPSSPSLPQDLDELQQRLEKRVGEKEQRGAVVPMGQNPAGNARPSKRYPWRIAAAIILLLGLGLTAYFTFLNTGRPKDTLAKAGEKQNTSALQEPSVTSSATVADSTTQKVPSPPKEDSSANALGSIASSPSFKKQTGRKEQEPAAKEANRAPEPAAASGAVSSVPPATDKDVEALAKIAPGVAINREGKALPVTTIPQATAPTAFGQEDKANAFKKSYMIRGRADTTSYKQETTTNQGFVSIPDQPVYTGKVIDQNNNPLPGASLFLAGNYSVSSTITDKNGLFSLRLPKKDSAIKLTVASVGYEQASLSLSMQNRTGNVIRLQPQNNTLNEVVVTGLGVKRKEILKDNSQPRKPFVTKRAAPADGWPAYEIYLEANKKIINPDSTIKGDEIISFLVDKEGGLSSFKVEQSLSTAHDSAAIHLVQQGPSWKLLKGKKGRAWVTISF